ncbi:unnamed protein product [Discosporangium mesarthrocarpum]
MLTNCIHKWTAYLPTAAASICCKTGFAPGTVNGEVFALVDWTPRPHFRSILDDTEKAMHSGYKRVHGLNYQGVVLPNGLLRDLCGPVVGSRHDAHMLDGSNLNPKVANMRNAHLSRI